MSDDGNREFVQGEELYKELLSEGTDNIETLTGNLLMRLGFKFSLSGTVYLKAAILYLYRNNYHPHVIHNKMVYIAVAEQYATTQLSVERDIRNAVAVCTQHGNLTRLNDLLHNNLVEKGFPPSNYELISCIAAWLRMVYQKEHPDNSSDETPLVF